MKLSTHQLRIFVRERTEADLNGTSEADIEKAIQNCTYRTAHGYDWIDDGAHAYCIVPIGDENWKIARQCESQYSRRYALMNGTILLEEDCDARIFLKTIKTINEK